MLTPTEAEALFENLRRLRDSGKSIVFISHKLDEVLEIADRITVLRRGKVVGETTPSETSKAQLAEMMVGRPVLFRLEKPATRDRRAGAARSRASTPGGSTGWISRSAPGRSSASPAWRATGNATWPTRSWGCARSIPAGSSSARFDLTTMETAAIRQIGTAFVPEDRQEQGLVLDMSLWENAVLGRQEEPEFSRAGGILSIGKIKRLAGRLIEEYDVRARNIDVTARTLSGGNQQKLILARELDGDPQLLLAAQPTRGLDVGAIEFVWRQILDQKAAGRAVLLISAELDEIYALSDRIVTLFEGRITAEYPPDAPPEEVGRGMLGDVDVAEAG